MRDIAVPLRKPERDSASRESGVGFRIKEVWLEVEIVGSPAISLLMTFFLVIAMKMH
ncbi:hypothetical protein Krac_8369 [Ktedonobacter racemifer DSM 44963]|uniref:Uncharacterized protein n=1 Tax=Ktedonobacter racemifer DSM 44963 TaxID=485913 RepID=D6TMP8_KTERA|nr:hypothetical protein Krac_8369 [Ktedonobacter racemifer DSM 44963]